MKVHVLIFATVYVVQAELFVRSYNSILNQIILEKQIRSARECSTLCDRMTECNAFNFATTEQRCTLARNVIDVANVDGNVYTRKSFNFVSIETYNKYLNYLLMNFEDDLDYMMFFKNISFNLTLFCFVFLNNSSIVK